MKSARASIIPALATAALLAAGLLTAATAAGQPPRPAERWPPPREQFQIEHPQHRLAYWYANESMRQAAEAREMVCGFTGQRWALDWELHYRWALRAVPRRAYQRVDERAQHLATCRSRKLQDHQRPRYGRGRNEPDRSD